MTNDPVTAIWPGLVLLAGLSACTAEEPNAPEVREVKLLQVPAGPKSTSPRLAAGPDGTVVLSWLEADGRGHALKYSMLQDEHWVDSRVVARGENWFVNWADFPSVVPVSATLWAAHWLVNQPAGLYAYDIDVALSSDSGRSWSQTITPHDDGTETEHGFVSLFPDSAGVAMVWLDGRKMINEPGDDIAASGMMLRGARLSADLRLSDEQLIDELICECCQTDVALTADGPVAVYRDRTSRETRDIYVTKHVGYQWQAGKAIANDNWNIAGCPVSGPAIDARESKVSVAWFTAAGNEPRVRVASSGDAAQTFSAPIDVVSGDTLGRVGVALLPGGDIAVSWLRETAAASAEVCVRRVSRDARLGRVHVVSAGQEVSNLSVPQMLRHEDTLLFAWTGRVDGHDRVVSGRIPIEGL